MKQYITLGLKELNKEKFQPIINRAEFPKPQGGLWSSTYTPNGEYVSDWHRWCYHESPQWIEKDAVIFSLKENANIYIINNQQDLINLINEIGEQPSILPCSLKLNTIVDYEKASKVYDAILLTEEGQWATRFPHENNSYSLYGWDCESILIMNYDCINKWEYKILDIETGGDES